MAKKKKNAGETAEKRKGGKLLSVLIVFFILLIWVITFAFLIKMDVGNLGTSLRPMILQDIAERTGYDVSTISRVSNSKYVQTRYGVYPLKYFFSEAMTNAEGDEISTREIKKILQELIENEDKRAPLTDEQLVALLGKHGYPIARRTVAKYRDVLNIPVARLRKSL